jgi:hypothetical protein
MSRPTLEVAAIARAVGNRFWEEHKSHFAWVHRKVLDAIVRCRTAALGGHRDKCVRCGHLTASYNSCLMGSNFLWRVRRQERIQSKVPGLWNSPLTSTFRIEILFVEELGIRNF